MCEAHWPFDACSFGGRCNETLGVCVCNEGYRRSSRLFDLDKFDCVTPDILFDIQVHLGMLVSAASIVVLCWTIRSKNYFIRLNEAQSPIQARKYQRCAAGALLSDVSFLLFFARLRSPVPTGKISYMADIYLTVLFQVAALSFWLYLLDFYLISARNVIRLGLVINAGDTNRKLKWAGTHGWYIMVFLTLVLGLGTPIIYKFIGPIPGIQFNLIVVAAITLNGSYIGISTSRCLINCLDIDSKSNIGGSRSSIENEKLRRVTSLRESHVRFIKVWKHAKFGATFFALLFLVWPWMQSFATAHVLQVCVNGASFNTIAQRLFPKVALKSSRKSKVSTFNGPQIASRSVLASKRVGRGALSSVVSNQGLTASSASRVSDE